MIYVLIGEAPNAATVGLPNLWLRPDLSGIRHTANRLRDLAGWSTSEYLRIFDRRTNAWHAPGLLPIKYGRGRVSKFLAESMVDRPFDGVVFVGRRSSMCAWWSSARPSDWLTWGSVNVINLRPGTDEPTTLTVPAATIPHPSGRNLWYNDPANAARVREFLRAL